MYTNSPTAGAVGLFSGSTATGRRSKLPLSLLRHGSGLVAFGLLFGFVVPLTPYPRLGLTAHIQFCMEGTMVIVAGLVLQSNPFADSRASDLKSETDRPSAEENMQLADRMGWLNRRIIYWGLVSIWVTLLSEAGNAWWGTRNLLSIAHEAAGLHGRTSAAWMETAVSIAHKPVLILAAVWPIILHSLF